MERKNCIMIRLLPSEIELVKEACEKISIAPASLSRMLLIKRSRDILRESSEVLD